MARDRDNNRNRPLMKIDRDKLRSAISRLDNGSMRRMLDDATDLQRKALDEKMSVEKLQNRGHHE